MDLLSVLGLCVVLSAAGIHSAYINCIRYGLVQASHCVRSVVQFKNEISSIWLVKNMPASWL